MTQTWNKGMMQHLGMPYWFHPGQNQRVGLCRPWYRQPLRRDRPIIS
jgi:hypothetical protein